MREPANGDGRRALLTARRSGFSSGVIFPHRRPALRSHRPQLALPLFGGTVSVTAFLYLRGYLSTVFPGLQPPHLSLIHIYVPWVKRMTRIIIPIQKSSIISGYLLPFMTCLLYTSPE